MSRQGLDTNPGSADQPFLTITNGISAAAADPLKRTVLVAEGTYSESISLADGVSVFGQYQAGSWARDPAYYTIIDGISSAANHDRTVIASSIISATTIDGFVIFGAVNDKPGGNSYAIYVVGSNANLHITNNVIFGGHGGPGAAGSAGPDGLDGIAGSGRNPNLSIADATYDAKDANGTGECDLVNNRQYANGGALMCGGIATNGGAGGGNRCPVMSHCTTQAGPGCSAFTWTKYTALDGLVGSTGGVGAGGAGAGATSGDDSVQVYSSTAGGYVCYLSGATTYGLDGNAGGSGTHGSAVAGCAAPSGAVIGGDWVGGAAPTGVAGGNGGGGGGGGAGGGGKCQTITGHTTCADGGGKDTLGGHGGGGGSGGCGGAAGVAGNTGGGAFGIFLVGSSAAPVVSGNTLFGGSGGRGGAGGNGGTGGSGGLGALGGTTGVPIIFCTDAAGGGGGGGGGGDGSGAGGGCGGASYGIYTYGIGTPDYCTGVNNTIIDGAAGPGGVGGLSLVNTGGSGVSGVLAGCSFN